MGDLGGGGGGGGGVRGRLWSPGDTDMLIATMFYIFLMLGNLAECRC